MFFPVWAIARISWTTGYLQRQITINICSGYIGSIWVEHCVYSAWVAYCGQKWKKSLLTNLWHQWLSSWELPTRAIWQVEKIQRKQSWDLYFWLSLVKFQTSSKFSVFMVGGISWCSLVCSSGYMYTQSRCVVQQQERKFLTGSARNSWLCGA